MGLFEVVSSSIKNNYLRNFDNDKNNSLDSRDIGSGLSMELEEGRFCAIHDGMFYIIPFVV